MKLLISLLSTGLLLMPFAIRAEVTAAQLSAACTSDQPIAQSQCKTYLKGFVDGAFVTDPRVAERVVDEAGKISQFVTRAFKTRIGEQIERYGASYFADFCLPEADAELHVFEAMQLHKPLDAGEDENAKEWTYTFVKKHFPCES